MLDLNAIALIWKQNPYGDELKYLVNTDSNASEFVGYLFIAKLGYDMYRVPKKWLCEEMYKLLAENNGNNFKMIPDHLKTYELCETIIKNKGNIIANIPKHILTKELCELSFKHHPWSILDIPEDYITEEMCKHFIECRGRLCIVPDKFRNLDMITFALKCFGANLDDISKELITTGMIDIAINTYGCALKYFSEEDKTYVRCFTAVSNDGLAFDYVPDPHKDLKLCTAAVKNKGHILSKVPPEFHPQLYDIAVSSECSVFEIFPPEEQTLERCMLALAAHKCFCPDMCYIPDRFKTRDVCIQFILKDTFNLQYIPNELKTLEFYEYIFNICPPSFQFIPTVFITFDMCKKIVGYNISDKRISTSVYENVPIKYINHSLFMN